MDLALFEAIVQSSHDAIVATDLRGRILSWNPGAERLYGYPAAEAVGRPVDDLIPPAGRAAHRDRYVEAMRDWYAEGKPLGTWTIPYLLRHTAYHALDHAWEMQDRDLTGA